MTTNVYSISIFEGAALGSGSYVTTAVPAGYVWVVREILAINHAHAPYEALNGVRIYRTSGATMFETGAGVTTGDKVYHQVFRKVLAAGQTMTVVVREAGWDVSIMGYQLSLP